MYVRRVAEYIPPRPMFPKRTDGAQRVSLFDDTAAALLNSRVTVLSSDVKVVTLIFHAMFSVKHVEMYAFVFTVLGRGRFPQPSWSCGEFSSRRV